MRAIVLTEAGRLEMREVPTPDPGPGQVRVRTGACGVCATDLDMIGGDPRVARPAILGHEWSGVVDAVGVVDAESLAGRPCVAENVLADGGEVGFEHPGGYGEFLLTEAANLHVLPDGFPLAAAALVEPLAVCVRAMSRLALTDKRAALVFGDGPIGLLMVALLARAGVEDVLVVGGRGGRLRMALALGAGEVLNYHATSDLVRAVRGGAERRFPNVVEASGSPAAMEAALRVASYGGKVLVVGDYGQARAEFRWNRLLHGELHLIGSNASAGAWPEAVRTGTDASFPLARLVSARFPADRFDEAIHLVRRRGDEVKVVLEWSA